MKSLFLGIAFVVLIGIGGFVYGNALERPFEPITCPLDAKLCPDGTSVGRAGTSCVFPACPPPNTSVAELGIAFAIPFGFSETEPRAGSVVAYASDATPEPEAEIIISTFAVASSSTALLTIQETARTLAGASAPATAYTSKSFGTRRFTVVAIERADGLVQTAYYLARTGDVLRFDAIDRGVPNWNDSRLVPSDLPAHKALEALLTKLQSE